MDITQHNSTHVTMVTLQINETVKSIDEEVDIVYITIEIVVAILAAIGNLLVIVVFAKYPSIRTNTNYYVMSLAMADLLVALLGIPFAIATSMGLPRNFHACIFMNSLLLLLCTGSIFSLVAVAIDRFWAIRWPLSYPRHMTSNMALKIIGVSWVLAAIWGLLPSMGWNAGPAPVPRCLFMEVMDKRYLATLYFCTILLPMVIMAVVYCFIFQAVTHQVRRMSVDMLPKISVSSAQNQLLRSQTRAAKILAVIIILFCVSWIPLYTFNAIVCFCDNCASIPSAVIKFLIILSHCNSAWNPVLYAYGMKDFKRALCKLCGNRRKESWYYIVYETRINKCQVKSNPSGIFIKSTEML